MEQEKSQAPKAESRRSRRHRANLSKRKVHSTKSPLVYYPLRKSRLTYPCSFYLAAHVALQKTKMENRLRKQNYRYLNYMRQSRQVSHAAQEELKRFFRLSPAEQRNPDELRKVSKEAKTVWERLEAERRAAQAKEHYLVPDDWWAEGKKWNGGKEHIPKRRKGEGKGKGKEGEGEDAGNDEAEMWKEGEEEEVEDNDGEDDDDEEGGVMLGVEGGVMAPEPRSPAGGWDHEMEAA